MQHFPAVPKKGSKRLLISARIMSKEENMGRAAGIIVLLVAALFFGCASGGRHLAPPGEYGLTDSVDELVDRFDEFTVYASRDRASTTALVFDRREDDWTIQPWGSVWRQIGTVQELSDYISEMRWAYGQGNTLRALRAPDGQGAAGLVYSPTIVGTSAEGRTITVRGVSLRDACTGSTVYFGSGPCIDMRQNRR
jgi:hypothetical protein